jgi:hypothetical protein
MPIGKNEDPALIFHSGLGNQLFQWSAFVIAAKSGVPIRPAFVRSLLSKSRELQVESLLRSQGYEISEFSDLEFRLGRKIARSKFFSRYFQSKYLDLTNNPFELLDFGKINRCRSILGYFQQVKYIEKNIDLIFPLIDNYLRSITLPTNFYEIPLNVIHIRRGDLNSDSNKIKYGILSEKYYSNIDLDSDCVTYIVTDDVIYAEEISTRMKIAEILGPEKLDEWQAFKLMTMAKNLYSANSTLSLWAGILGQQKGNALFLPDPFFRDENFDILKALSPNGAKLLKSDFIN